MLLAEVEDVTCKYCRRHAHIYCVFWAEKGAYEKYMYIFAERIYTCISHMHFLDVYS